MQGDLVYQGNLNGWHSGGRQTLMRPFQVSAVFVNHASKFLMVYSIKLLILPCIKCNELVDLGTQDDSDDQTQALALKFL